MPSNMDQVVCPCDFTFSQEKIDNIVIIHKLYNREINNGCSVISAKSPLNEKKIAESFGFWIIKKIK